MKRSDKQSKVSRIDQSKALAAQADAGLHVHQPVPGSGAAGAAEGSDCTWHQDLCTMTCMIVANTTAGTEQRS